MEMTPPGVVHPTLRIDWSGSGALRGIAYALPATAVAPFDVRSAAALAIGVIPAAIVPFPPLRRHRVRLAVLSLVAATFMFAGSTLSLVPVLAVAGLFALCVAVSLTAARTPALGGIGLTLVVPVFAIGLSYPGSDGLGVALLIACGGIYAWLVSLPWPSTTRAPVPARPIPSRSAMLDYGVRLGSAGALCAAIGFAANFDHVGWATAAATLVMRPSPVAESPRAVGRVVSVVSGAALAVVLIALAPPNWVAGIAVFAVVVSVTATARSTYYVTPVFTTFLVFVLLAYGSPEAAEERFGERLGETLLGVAVAYVFGVLVPLVRSR